MNLTIQVSMQRCSLQYQTLLSPPDTSTTERHFHFGLAASFFLELLVIALLFFPSSILDTFGPRGAHPPVSYLFAFHAVHRALGARMLEWFAISSSSGPLFVRTLHYDLSVLGGPALQAHSFIGL